MTYLHLWSTGVVLGLLATASLAAAPVAKLDLSQHEATDKVQITRLGGELWEWSLPDGLGQTLTLNLDKLGLDPADYDEIRFEIKPLGSQVGLHTLLTAFPTETEASSWHLKFKAVTGEWTEGRYDLRVDDDGVWQKNEEQSHLLKLTLQRRLLGFAGEPIWRKAQIRNLRLIKYQVAATFNLVEAEIVTNDREVAYTYPLQVENRTEHAVTARLVADSAGTLKRFKVEAPGTVALGPGEKKTVPVRLQISRKDAEALPALYSEPLYPKVYLDGVVDSDMTPLMGYRRWPMWASVPVFNRVPLTPERMQTTLAAWRPSLPGVEEWRAGALRAGDTALGQDWPIPPLDLLPTGFDQSYRCNDCGVWLQPVARTDFYKHTCPKCKKIIENDAYLSKCYVSHYVSAYGNAVRALGLAYQLTGKAEYVQKATGMLLAYAEAAPTIPVTGHRSTSGGSHLKLNTLHSSYAFQPMVEGYDFISAAPSLAAADRAKIERFLRDEALLLARHGSEYNNQGAEHFRGYGSAGLATGYWPLAAAAIAADYGWHDMVEYSFTEDGIGHEGGAYHGAIVGAMGGFAVFAHQHGVELMTPRFKRVFDGSLALGLNTPLYELAYRVYREPLYLPLVTQWRQRANEITMFCGVPEIPDATKLPARSVLMKGSGYLFLRKGTAQDFREIRMNYIQQFDRLEADRLTTFLYNNRTQIDSTPARIAYSVPGAEWMAATAAHNTIVINGGDQRTVDGRLIAADLSPETPIAVVGTLAEAPYYEGVQQVRGIALIDDAYIVFDRISANRPVTIDRYQYGKGKVELQFATAPVGELPRLPEAGRFKDVEGGSCGREARINFGDLRMRLVSDLEVSGYRATTFGGYQGQPMEVTFVRADGVQEVSFLAAFVQGTEEPPLLRIKESTAARMVLEVESHGKVYTLAADLAKQAVKVTAR